MDRSFSIPKSMKRCRSLSGLDNVIGEGGGSRKGSKESAGKQKVTAPKVYRGRMSLGRPAGTASRIQRRKSNNRGSRFIDDDDEEYYPKYSDDMHLTPAHSVSTFRCLPVIERESSSTSIESQSRKNSEAGTLSMAVLSVDERYDLFTDLARFLNADRNAKTSKLIVNQRMHGEYQKSCFTIGTKKEKHKYGDVLWLILKAYFSGRELSGGQDATFEEDSLVCNKREAHWSIVDQIVNYTAPSFSIVNYCFDPEYMNHLTEVRRAVHDLLEELDHYQLLFPNRRTFLDFVSSRKDVAFVTTFCERVDVMTAWLTTVDDLVEKLRVLGEVFEVDRLPNAHAVWPRPLSRSRIKVCLKDSRPVFKAYVGRSLNLKGMKKVLTRVWDICETSLVKAALLLHRPPKSYAQAASGSRPHLPLDDEMRRRYDSEGTSTSRYGPCNEHYQKMQLPTFIPLFYFLLGVRLELVLEWLSIRVTSTLPTDSDVDTLTMETLIEDSRDCVEEAVRVKRHYISVVQATCPRSQYPEEFDTRLFDVFTKYLWFVSCWSRAMAARGDLHHLFPRLEKEWAAAVVAARSIRSGVEHLTTTFSSLVPHLLDTLILEYWERNAEKIMEDHSIRDIAGSDDDERDDEGSIRDSSCVFTACREHNRIIRDVKDRAARILALLRAAVADLHDARGYEMRTGMDILAERLRDRHCLVDFGERQSTMTVSLFIDSKTADLGGVDELVAALGEGRPLSGNIGHFVTVPGTELARSWMGRRVKPTVADEMLVSFGYLRSDCVCVMGKYEPEPALLELTLPNCSSNEIVDGQLRELTSSLVEHSQRTWEMLVQMWSVFEHDCTNVKMRDSINSTLQHGFTFVFQLHRDVFRFVNDSSRMYVGHEMMSRSIRIVEKWRDLVQQWTRPIHTTSIPLWASHAFNFFHYLAEPKWTSLLTDEEFADFRGYVADCKQLIVSPSASVNPAATLSPRASRTSSIASRMRHSTSSHESRRSQLKEAAIKTDRLVADRQQHSYQVGKVIDFKHEKVPLTMDPNKKAPFEWQILEKIGSGQFADVYKALNVDKRCVIAVKKIRVDRSVLKIVEAEIDIFRNLNHPNLVKYYGFQILQDEVHILMEYCAEGTLERICREGLDMTLVRMYTNSLLLAIEYMHKNKVVHRDIKPANIFLDFRCRLKLGDFGCSVRLREAATVLGELADYAGTPQYMAPEIQTYGGQLEDGRYRGYGRAVDIWSLGCVVLQMVTGRRPWPEDMHAFQITMKVCQGEKPPYPANALAILRSFLDACFEFNPDERKCAEALLQDPFANIHVDVESVFSMSGLHSPFDEHSVLT